MNKFVFGSVKMEIFVFHKVPLSVFIMLTNFDQGENCPINMYVIPHPTSMSQLELEVKFSKNYQM